MASTETTEKTAAAKLWDQIKVIPIDIFALPNQKIGDHAMREEGMDAAFPNDLYLILRSAATYPALEEALTNAVIRNQVKLPKDMKFELSQSSRYTVLKVVPR